MKKGFTLIELLAVIVILAILALITVPIVADMIDSSKKETNKVSVKNYVRAVDSNLVLYEIENQETVPTGVYSVMSDGNLCLSEIINNTCSNILKISLDGEKPNGGSVSISNNKVTTVTDLTYNNFKANMYANGEITISDIFEKNIICEAVDSSKSGSVELGTEYKCAVNSTTNYNFYVLSTNGDKVSLIMKQNLKDNVEYVRLSDFTSELLTPNWLGDSSYNGNELYIFTQLNNLTSTWSNVPNINETYNTVYRTTTILTGKARLATFDEIAEKICKSGPYLDSSGRTDEYYSNCSSWILGDYWTITSNRLGDWHVYAMNTEYNTLDDFGVNKYYSTDENPINTRFGIRPVITLNKSNLE